MSDNFNGCDEEIIIAENVNTNYNKRRKISLKVETNSKRYKLIGTDTEKCEEILYTNIPNQNELNTTNLPLSKDQNISVYSHSWYTQYADDILETYFEKEKKRLKFLSQSPQSSHRNDVVDFVKYVAMEKSLSRTTVHLAIYLVDIFMDNYDIALDKLNLVGIVLLLISSKIEESELKIPKINELNFYTEKSYPLTDYVALEKCILNFFQYDIMIPTASVFIEYYIEGIIDYNDLVENNIDCVNKSNIRFIKQKLGKYVLEYLDLTLKDVQMMQELPSIVSAACLAAARQTIKFHSIWTPHLEKLTKYKFSDIVNCMFNLIALRNTELFNNSLINTKSIITITPESGYMSDYAYYDEDDNTNDNRNENNVHAEFIVNGYNKNI